MHDSDNKQATAMSVKMIATITSHEDENISGELTCHHFNEPIEFTCLVRMIEIMEKTFDNTGFPEKHLLPRTFHKSKQRLRKHELNLHDHIKKIQTDIVGMVSHKVKSSFEIVVQFRHNAEWQGQIHWIEKGITKKFSGIVEMLMLINSALPKHEAQVAV
ncbi:MAG: hypothetical protein FWC20_10560 [Oscillospiraceae bacterium]|nr:hypothetical protein [Oscillospiraceae bacterium]MCL2279830.1 hypothetical protein [Oscillospiraceae bacterium]